MDKMAGQQQMQMREGDTFTCPNCNCQITLNHHGDSERMQDMRPFTCCCGTQMQQEQGSR